MATEFEAHRRQKLIGKRGLSAGTEPFEQRRAQDVSRYAFVNGRRERPTAFAGVGHAARKLRERRVGCERVRGKVEQPGSDYAAAAPDLRDIREIEVVLIVLRMPKRR